MDVWQINFRRHPEFTMTFDEINASTKVLQKYDPNAIISFMPEGGVFHVIFENPLIGDDEIHDIREELLKLTHIDLTRTAVTETGVRLLIRSAKLQFIALPPRISIDCVREVLQMPMVHGVRIPLPSPPSGFEAVAEWPNCDHSTDLIIRRNPRIERDGQQPVVHR